MDRRNKCIGVVDKQRWWGGNVRVQESEGKSCHILAPATRLKIGATSNSTRKSGVRIEIFSYFVTWISKQVKLKEGNLAHVLTRCLFILTKKRNWLRGRFVSEAAILKVSERHFCDLQWVHLLVILTHCDVDCIDLFESDLPQASLL